MGPPAGGGPRGMMDPGRRADRMKHELNLTDDQTAQVKSILEDGRTKMEAIHSNSSLSRDDRRAQMMSIHKAQDDRIEALLTPDQKTKFEAMQERMRERMRGGQGGPPAGDTTPPPPQN
jgi:Spy/CpxP family protein refolding chaperone